MTRLANHWRLGVIVGASTLSTLLATAALAQSYIVTNLGTLPDTRRSRPEGINNAGQIAGTSWAGGGVYRGFFYDNGTLTDLGSLGGDTLAFGINSAGQVTGVGLDVDETVATAFIWENGVFEILSPLPGGIQSAAYAIADDGTVVGLADTPTREGHAVMWNAVGEITDLGTLPGGADSWALGINTAGQIVGKAENAAGVCHGFLYENGVMTELDPFGAGWGMATDINEVGQVTGSAMFSELEQHGYVYHDGIYQDLGTLGGDHSTANGINNLGHIVGTSNDADHDPRAFLWKDGTMIDLNTLIPQGTDWDFLWQAVDINDRGEIIGVGLFQGELAGFLLTPIETCLGDLDVDGDIDLSDLARLLSVFGKCMGTAGFDPLADLDSSNCIDEADLLVMLPLYGTICP